MKRKGRMKQNELGEENTNNNKKGEREMPS